MVLATTQDWDHEVVVVRRASAPLLTGQVPQQPAFGQDLVGRHGDPYPGYPETGDLKREGKLDDAAGKAKSLIDKVKAMLMPRRRQR